MSMLEILFVIVVTVLAEIGLLLLFIRTIIAALDSPKFESFAFPVIFVFLGPMIIATPIVLPIWLL